MLIKLMIINTILFNPINIRNIIDLLYNNNNLIYYIFNLIGIKILLIIK